MISLSKIFNNAYGCLQECYKSPASRFCIGMAFLSRAFDSKIFCIIGTLGMAIHRYKQNKYASQCHSFLKEHWIAGTLGAITLGSLFNSFDAHLRIPALLTVITECTFRGAKEMLLLQGAAKRLYQELNDLKRVAKPEQDIEKQIQESAAIEKEMSDLAVPGSREEEKNALIKLAPLNERAQHLKTSLEESKKQMDRAYQLFFALTSQFASESDIGNEEWQETNKWIARMNLKIRRALTNIKVCSSHFEILQI